LQFLQAIEAQFGAGKTNGGLDRRLISLVPIQPALTWMIIGLQSAVEHNAP
jgi:hypothetical protein